VPKRCKPAPALHPGSVAAVRGHGVAGSHLPGAERVALLPHDAALFRVSADFPAFLKPALASPHQGQSDLEISWHTIFGRRSTSLNFSKNILGCREFHVSNTPNLTINTCGRSYLSRHQFWNALYAIHANIGR
jgi:hypothetical protein